MKITLGRTGHDCRVELDGVEVRAVTQVQVVVTVRAIPLVIITMIPEAIEIEGEAEVQTVAPGPGAADEGGALVPDDVAEALRDLVPGRVVRGATRFLYMRCDNHRGGRSCERASGHEGRHLERDPNRENELWSWGPPGNADPTRVHTAQCGRCDGQMRPDLVTINVHALEPDAPLFACGNAADCAARADARGRPTAAPDEREPDDD